jgi:transcriptional regulator with XRE-family HTH domain
MLDRMIGRKIRLQRIRHEMTQKKLAAKLEVSFQQIQKYESGVNKVSIDRLWQLSQIFSVPLHYWISVKEETETVTDMPHIADRRATHIMHYFARIEDEQLKNLLFAFTKRLAGREVMVE